MKLFQNKFFIVCLCVAVVLCAVPSTFAIMGYGALSKNIVGTLTAPIRWCVTGVVNGIEGFGRYFTSIDALQAENEALREEISSLRADLDREEILEAENERLRDYLEIKDRHPSFQMAEGMVIGYSTDNSSYKFTLNCGTLHGIGLNMPAIVKDGVVGYVSEVGLTWCTVTAILEQDSSVGAYIPRSGACGIVTGDYALSREGLCRINYIEAGSDVQVGDRVYSSGTGSVYPSDLLIGEIVSVEVDEYSRAIYATMRPSVDFSALKWVVILTDYATENP